MRMDILKKEVGELMEVIIDDSPENIPLKKKAIERLTEVLYRSKWIEKQVKENGILPTKGWEDVFQDCVQECYMSIITKCAEYNPEKNAQPMTYLTSILTYTVQDFKKKIMNPGATEHYANLANKVRGALSALKEEGYQQPSTEMVATYTGLSIRQAEEALTIIRSGGGYDSFILSPDAGRPGVHEDISARPVSVGRTPIMRDPADFMVDVMKREAVREELDRLGGPEMKAFLLYYGYGDYENAGCACSYQAVARRLGISSKEAKKMIEGIKHQLVKNLVFRTLYEADE